MNSTDANPMDVISPKKTSRTAVDDDTSTHLPSLRTDRDRDSPGPNRKLPGSGAAKPKSLVFGTADGLFSTGPHAPGRGNLALDALLRMAGPGHPFVFADNQQAEVHAAALVAPVIAPVVPPAAPPAMEDVQEEAHNAPMYVFGGPNGTHPAANSVPPFVVNDGAPAAPPPPRLRQHVEALLALDATRAHENGAAPNAHGAAGNTNPAAPAAAPPFAPVQAPVVVPKAAPVFPNLDEHSREEPVNRHLNPHRKLPAAAQMDLAGPADIGRVTKCQPNVGNNDRLVMVKSTLEENCHPDTLAKINDDPDNHVYAVPFNGGAYIYSRLPKMPEILTEALIADGLINPTEFTVFPIAAADPNFGKAIGQNRYVGPLPLGIHLSSTAAAIALRNQGTAIIDRTHAFHLISPKDLTNSWFACAYKVSVGGDSTAGKHALRGALSKVMWTEPAASVAVDRYTSSYDKRPIHEHMLAMSKTIEVRWSRTMEGFSVYVEPCMPNTEHWKEIIRAFCGRMLVNGYFAFTPIIDFTRPTLGPLCVLCKNDDHFATACPFPQDPHWWGPLTQLSGITEGPLASRGRRGGRGGDRARGGRVGRGRGAPRGRGGGN
ncbi:hypothetical protein DFH09DRAFT_1316512 [Mycena vulgaris]|nr:hypothetical protein DFH09DRAFT_1316512 [Mycena vulgaris]